MILVRLPGEGQFCTKVGANCQLKNFMTKLGATFYCSFGMSQILLRPSNSFDWCPAAFASLAIQIFTKKTIFTVTSTKLVVFGQNLATFNKIVLKSCQPFFEIRAAYADHQISFLPPFAIGPPTSNA